jgi:hypothetical protein
MKLIITIIFALIGSILVGSSISELGFIGNGLMKLGGAICLLYAIYIGRLHRNKK